MGGIISTGIPGSTRKEEVEREIARLLEARSLRAAAYGTRFAELWRVASECVLGGKLLRPRLLLGAFDALSTTTGRDEVFRDAALRIAAGVELLHYSFLLHDDVIDGDLMRRGRPNLIGTFLLERDPAAFGSQASRNGEAALADLHWASMSGILMGDMLLSAAHQVFAREALPDPVRLRLLDLLDHTITESVAGEHLDLALSDGVVSSDLDTVLGMSLFKTATYTFELPLKVAAILAGTASRTEDAIGAIGRHLGLAFQLQDDLLSTFGCAAEHGKDAFSDLREGKETAIIAYARLTSAWTSIEPAFGDPRLSEEDGRAIRALLVECGAELFIRSLIDEQLRASSELVSSPGSGIPEELAGFIARLAKSIEERRL
ncbi:MAG: polyprenyl synthetase family protein [Microbacteriaceae bacterium]